MSRRRTSKKKSYSVDTIYQITLVHILANRLIYHGKKFISYSILHSVLHTIQENTQREPLAVLEYAVRLVTPIVHLKARRVGGTTYQVPIEVDPRRGTSIAIRWILAGARKRSERDIVSRLSREILDATSGNGFAVRKRNEVHRIAEANKAFARYRF